MPDQLILATVFSFMAMFNIPTDGVEFKQGDVNYFQEGVIYLTPQAMKQDHIIVHELVHYGQWVANGNAKNWNEWNAREKSAQLIEYVYLNNSI